MSEILIDSIDITEELRDMLDGLFPSGLIPTGAEAAVVPAGLLQLLDARPPKAPPETPPTPPSLEEQEEEWERQRKRFAKRRRGLAAGRQF